MSRARTQLVESEGSNKQLALRVEAPGGPASEGGWVELYSVIV